MQIRVLLLFIALSTGVRSVAAPLRVDGRFADWGGVEPAAVDPAGDASGALDLTRVWVASAGPVLYLRLAFTTVLNLHNGPETDGTLSLEVTLPDGESLHLDFRKREAVLPGPRAQRVGLSEIPFTSLPTHAADAFELGIDLAAFGVRRGGEVVLRFGGSDELAEPLTAAWSTDAPPPRRRSAERGVETDLRVACMNTLAGGLGSEEREAALGRLLRAVRADVYCFQEEEGTPDIPVRLARLMPGESPWRIHRRGGCVIATRHALEPAALDADFIAAATLRLPGKPPVVVASVHLTCCGSIGGEADARRIEEAGVLARALDALRGGPETPVVATGDYNLVGSRTPLNRLETTGLEHWLLPHLIGEAVTTWRDEAMTFPPGVLDMVLHDGLIPQNGFVLDTAELNPQECAALGVHPDDSEVSDHLLLVADFRFPEL